jgi:hypothetical protein
MAETLRVVARAPRPVLFPASGWLWTRAVTEGAMARVEVWECHGCPVRVKCAFIVPAACLESDGRFVELHPGIYRMERADAAEAPTWVITEASEPTNLVLFVIGGEVTAIRGQGVVIAHAQGACPEEPRLRDDWAMVAAAPGSVVVSRVYGILFGGERAALVVEDGLELVR